jgi:hypothetical protein
MFYSLCWISLETLGSENDTIVDISGCWTSPTSLVTPRREVVLHKFGFGVWAYGKLGHCNSGKLSNHLKLSIASPGGPSAMEAHLEMPFVEGLAASGHRPR